MAVPEKKSLQTYLLEKEKSEYIEICEKRKVKASSEIRIFIQSQIKKHKKELENAE